LEADNKKRKRKSSRREKKERCKGLSIKPNYPKEVKRDFYKELVAVKSIKN